MFVTFFGALCWRGNRSEVGGGGGYVEAVEERNGHRAVGRRRRVRWNADDTSSP